MLKALKIKYTAAGLLVKTRSQKNRYCSHKNILVSSINLIASLITLLILRVTTIFILIY